MIENTQALPAGTTLQSSARTYVIEHVLGQGGFGITYLAATTGRKVAIKELFINDISERVEGTTDVLVLNRMSVRAMASRKDFLSEAKRLEMVSGKTANVVKVSEVFEANNTAYYAMEYINGQSLEEYIRAKGRLSADEARALLTPIANALAVLHANRLTHLDVKPDNIMLSQEADGSLRPVLIDFGLSKHYDSKGNATSTINTMGFSDGYAPVEQYAGIRTFSPASDVYAFAATLYHALTGQRPPSAHDVNLADIAANLRKVNAPDDMREFIVAAMSPVRANRPPIWGAAPKSAPKSAATQIISDKKPRSKRPLYFALGILAVVVIGVVAFFVSRKSPAGYEVDGVKNLGFYEVYTRDNSAASEYMTYVLDNYGDSIKNKIRTGVYPGVLGIVLESDTAEVMSFFDRYKKYLPSDMKLAWAYNHSEKSVDGDLYELYMLKTVADKTPYMTGEYIAEVGEGRNVNGYPVVDMRMNEEGTRLWSALTANNIGQPIAIVIDDKVYSAPVVSEAITNGKVQISGGFSEEEIQTIINVLKSGDVSLE